MHVASKYNNKVFVIQSLMLASGSTVSGLPDHNDKISVVIVEVGMCELVLKSKAKNAVIN